MNLETPEGVRRIDVVTARDMLRAVREAFRGADALYMAAAVADWRPARLAQQLRGGGRSASRPRARRLVVVPREERSGTAPASEPPLSDPEERNMLDEVDRVLDKISAHGMSSLTAEERRLLDEVSKRRRTN